MAGRRESSETREKLSESEVADSKARAVKYRGKRELQSIEIETFENEDTDAGPWVFVKKLRMVIQWFGFEFLGSLLNVQEISTGKSKRSVIVANKSKSLPSRSDSQDQDSTPGTSKDPSPAPSSTAGEAEVATTGSRSQSETPDRLKKSSNKEQVSFFCGNPFVEKVKGILHFYKEKYGVSSQFFMNVTSFLILLFSYMTSLELDVPRSQMICMLAIPAWLSCHDLLNFLAPCCPGIRRVRIIRDKTPNQYMALVLFRSQVRYFEFIVFFLTSALTSVLSAGRSRRMLQGV